MHMSIMYHPFTADEVLTLRPYSVGVPVMAVRGTSGKFAVPSEEAGFCYLCPSAAVLKQGEGLNLDSNLLEAGVL